MAIDNLLQMGLTIENVAAKLCISPAAVRERHDEAARFAALQGATASPGQTCPYPPHLRRYRCAWLAAHYDRHGALAWEAARA